MRFRIARSIKLILLSLIILGLDLKNVQADTIVGEYQYIYDSKNNPIVTIKVLNDGRIYFYGYHAKSDSKITYHTTGFTVALCKSKDKNPDSLVNREFIERREDDGNSSSYKPRTFIADDSLIIDTYLLQSEEVIGTVIKLLKKEGYTNQQAYSEISKGVTVYFSNIFEVIARDTRLRLGCEQYYSYSAINKGVYDLTGSNWSNLTQKLLESYYDNPIQIKLTPFNYNVLYVDAKEYAKNGAKTKPLIKGEDDQLVMFGQYAQATLLPARNLTVKGQKYKYSSTDYVYENGQHNTVNLPKLSDGVISAYHGNKSDATMYVLLDQVSEPPTNTPTKTPTVTPSITPVPTVVTPAITENSVSYFDADSNGVIQTDHSKTAGYNAITGIPTTEYLYGSMQTSEYLLNIQYQVKTGQKTYPITVSKTYLLEKQSEKSISSQSNTSNKNENSASTKKATSNRKATSNKEATSSKESTSSKPATTSKDNTVDKGITTDPITVTQSGSITRTYQYTEIVSIDYYKISNGTLVNETLPKDKITLTPNNYSIPDLDYQHYEGEVSHLLAPKNAGNTITLDSEQVQAIPKEDLIAQGDLKVSDIQVRNDTLSFDGKTVLSASWVNQTAPDMNKSAIHPPSKTASSVLYQGNQQIARKLANGTYPSSGTITYQKVTSYRSTMPETISYPVNVNSVLIHTPVYCEPNISHDNQTYLQLSNPDLSCIPLIIDENTITSDFMLHIQNKGFHSSKTGYGNQDYSDYVATEAGKLKNEVRFPIEVYQDTGNDKDDSNDVLISSGTWTILASDNQRFYLPMWAPEGKYTIDVRSVANNGEEEVTKTQTLSNESVKNYVATNSFDVEVSGRLYGLTMYDIKDYPLWQDSFLSSNHLVLKRNLLDYQKRTVLGGVTNHEFEAEAVYDYRVGMLDSYGMPTKRISKYTLPLLNGSHPQYANKGMMTSGYAASFLLHTSGVKMTGQNSRIEITPKFYYVDGKGDQREEVELYYKGNVNGKRYSLIKVGSEVDEENKKIYSVGSKNLSIPSDELEMTATTLDISTTQLKSKEHALYTYSNISLDSTFRMYSNLAYARKYQSTSHSKQELASLKQTYYFQYSLPNGVRATKKGTDVAAYATKQGITFHESFWKKDGYLLVNFDIKAYDQDGNLRYSYTNKENYLTNGLCSMWILEGYQLSKTDYKGNQFNFLLGDVLMFDTDTAANDDYASSGIY